MIHSTSLQKGRSRFYIWVSFVLQHRQRRAAFPCIFWRSERCCTGNTIAVPHLPYWTITHCPKFSFWLCLEFAGRIFLKWPCWDIWDRRQDPSWCLRKKREVDRLRFPLAKRMSTLFCRCRKLSYSRVQSRLRTVSAWRTVFESIIWELFNFKNKKRGLNKILCGI